MTEYIKILQTSFNNKSTKTLQKNIDILHFQHNSPIQNLIITKISIE